MRTLSCFAALALVTGSAFAQATICPVPAPPPPTGVDSLPQFSNYGDNLDSLWLHSSTNLQGYATTEKFAPCLFFNPQEDDLGELSRFQSALVINNPSPTQATQVRVELRNRHGTVVWGTSVSIDPNGTWSRGVPELNSLAAGVGSARITSTHPIVGASLHYFDSVLVGGQSISDPDILHPGGNTMQQLQAAQAVGRNLYAGPMPLSNSTRFDFLNGNLPFYCVMNTSATPTNITAYRGTSNGVSLAPITTSLRGYGMFVDLSMWRAIEPFYLTGGAPFDDNGWAFVASDTTSLVGDLIMVDVFRGESSTGAMSLGRKFRAGSAMMANSPSTQLTSAEVTQQVGPVIPATDTLIGVLNASTLNIGPVTVTYRARNGAIAGTNTVASLPPGQTLRLVPGTPGFPNSPFFDGWAEIRACGGPGLIGWTMREVTRIGTGLHFEKAYGEELVGANGLEPGSGINVVEQGIPVNRKVAPFGRVSSWWWPGYTTFANNSVSNVGRYWYRFFEAVATAPIDFTNYAPQPFNGLRFGSTSFTYQDGNGSLVALPANTDVNISGRVDVTKGPVIGITTLGDPMREWGIDMYPADGTMP